MPERWATVERLYHEALARSAHERAAFLVESCVGDDALRREVESLIAHDGEAAFLSTPVVGHGVDEATLVGRTIGPYVVSVRIGRGGMGEVYRARDQKLGRDVAIKVLPSAFTSDRERLARFEREARVLAALNHPHIGAIYGLEDLDGVPALALELVEGDTLADRLQRGPIPVSDALTLSRQIADALDAAHERGIVHRDLKPANIKITSDGTVKVLDFGLAKVIAGEGAAPDLAPTPALTPDATRDRIILGTAAYMSPEQARGQIVDKRSDVWAFGCVLFEMITGHGAFAADTTSDTIARILEREPEWDLGGETTPESVRRLVRRCLEKDPKRRLRDIGDVRAELDDVLAVLSSATPVQGLNLDVSRRVPTPTAVAGYKVVFLGTVLGVAALSALVAWRMRGSRSDTPAPIAGIRLSLSSGNASAVSGGVAISPDGQTLASVALFPEGWRLIIRRLDSWESRKVEGTDGFTRPLGFSPDGKWLAFFGDRGIEKVPVGGGPRQLICQPGAGVRGGTWGRDGNIIFATWPNVGLWRVSADGGTPSILIQSSEGSGTWYLWPERPPGGQAVLFTIWRQGETSIAALVPGVAEPRTLVKSGAHPRYMPTGHLLYVFDGHLLAVPFDAQRLEIRGGATVVIDDVSDDVLRSDYDVSTNGTLVYAPSETQLDTLVWKDRRGATTPLGLKPRRYGCPALSPDGRRLAICVQEGPARNIWVGSVEGEPLTRVTFSNDEAASLWTRDGRRLFFNSGQNGRYNIFSAPADGSGSVERVTNSPHPQRATSWSPAGDVLLYTDADPLTKTDIWQLSIGRKEARPLVRTPFRETQAVFSPDGRWIAYESDESGQMEVYVRAYPGLGVKTQVSVAGGREARWNRNGRELFYTTLTAIMAVPVLDVQSFRVGAPVRLFSTDREYDVSPDGQRFLVIERADGGRVLAQLNLVQNWFEDLKARVPTK